MGRNPAGDYAYIKNADGTYQQGRIKNGVTYQGDGSRLQNGQSVIDQEGKEWAMNNGAGTATGNHYGGENPYAKGYQNQIGMGSVPRAPQQSTYDPLEESRRAYRELLRKQEEANRLAVQQGVGRLEANRGTINQGYDSAAQQAYLAKMQSQKNLGQQLAGQGITGGGSESARLALDTSYGNHINENELSRRNALTGLDQSIADLQTTGDLNLVEQQLSLGQQQIADYQNAYQQKLAQDNWLKQFEQSTKQSAYEMDMSKAAAEAEAEQNAYERWYKEKMLDNDTRRTNYDMGKPYYRPTVPKEEEMSLSERYRQDQAKAAGGNMSISEVERNQEALIGAYGYEKYAELYKLAGQNYGMKGINSLSGKASYLNKIGMGMSESYAKQVINDYQNGRISEAKARELLSAMGM